MLAAVKTAVATTAVVHAPPTRVSHDKIRVTARAMVPAMAVRHAANAAHQPHALHATISHANRVMKCSARTHAAPVLTWASSATTSTNASRPAMCQQAFHRLARPRVAQAVVGEAAIAAAVEAAETSVAAAHAPAVAAGATLAAGFGANRLVGEIAIKKQLQAAFLPFQLSFKAIVQ